MVHECVINVYGILMPFILNKHITIFTDNDMYHANVATSQIYDFAIYKLPVFPGCHFLSSCHHFINRQWLAVRLYHHIFMCSDNRPL